MAQFDLPDVGEGLTEAEIVSWKVQPGDEVAVNDVLVEIETAKSLVELPSPFAGTVTELMVDEGQTVLVGTPIISVDVPAGADEGQPAHPTTSVDTEREPVLVGYGPRPSRRRRRSVAEAAKGARALHGAFSRGRRLHRWLRRPRRWRYRGRASPMGTTCPTSGHSRTRTTARCR